MLRTLIVVSVVLLGVSAHAGDRKRPITAKTLPPDSRDPSAWWLEVWREGDTYVQTRVLEETQSDRVVEVVTRTDGKAKKAVRVTMTVDCHKATYRNAGETTWHEATGPLLEVYTAACADVFLTQN